MGCSGRSHENELVVIQRSCYQIPSWRRRLFTVCFLTLLSLFFWVVYMMTLASNIYPPHQMAS
jgi:hypothetical protein